MAKKHERLRKAAEEENHVLRDHLALQLRTIASLQNMQQSTPRPRQISLRLLLPRSSMMSGTGAQNTLDNLCSLLVSQLSETDQVFRLGNMPPTLSEESSEMVSSTQMHLEVLYSNHLPFHFQAAARALWKNCRNCHKSLSVDPNADTLANSFVSSYESDELSFAMNGHSTMRMHDTSTRNVIVSSSKYQLLLDNNGSGSHYSDKGWVVIEPAHDDATELSILRVCARIELNVDGHLSDGERYLDLLSGFLLEQKRQEVDTIRLGIENDLLAAPPWQVSL
ncbi:hypothetical protein PHYPSEUDO_001876 [Phytophthora pseudosyringae]|uniref:Uncharacterized protein n=1 Tax=Phytophthora pseudosyringae TaxID=221518 RepID=A0A8T1WJQ8_9STRA|nr:hypothetical protein PHYPSEUDO_001876 [Phytophthora pseudosyringae]